jgi:AcrR family transcriptional regulator
MYRNSTDKRIKTSQTMIFEAWKNLVIEKPHHHIKINELCKVAKVSRITFYRLYDQLDDVIRHQLDLEIASARKTLIMYRLKHPFKKGMLKPLLMYFYQHPHLIQLIFNAKLSHLLHEQFMENLLQYQPSLTEKDGPFLLSLRLSIAINILERWIKTEMTIPPETLFKTIKERMSQAIEELE